MTSITIMTQCPTPITMSSGWGPLSLLPALTRDYSARYTSKQTGTLHTRVWANKTGVPRPL